MADGLADCTEPGGVSPQKDSARRFCAIARMTLAVILSCMLHGLLFLFDGVKPVHEPWRYKITNQSASSRLMATLKEHPLEAEVVISGAPAQLAERESWSGEMAIDAFRTDVDMESTFVQPSLDPIFFPADQLTVRPRIVEIGEFDNEQTLAVVASGKLILKLWINEQGRVVEAMIEESDLPGVLGEAARKVFFEAQFVPGERGGLPVGATIRLEVSYDDDRDKRD